MRRMVSNMMILCHVLTFDSVEVMVSRLRFSALAQGPSWS